MSVGSIECSAERSIIHGVLRHPGLPSGRIVTGKANSWFSFPQTPPVDQVSRAPCWAWPNLHAMRSLALVDVPLRYARLFIPESMQEFNGSSRHYRRQSSPAPPPASSPDVAARSPEPAARLPDIASAWQGHHFVGGHRWWGANDRDGRWCNHDRRRWRRDHDWWRNDNWWSSINPRPGLRRSRTQHGRGESHGQQPPSNAIRHCSGPL